MTSQTDDYIFSNSDSTNHNNNNNILTSKLIVNDEKSNSSQISTIRNKKIESEAENETGEKKSIWLRLFGPIKEGSLRGSVLAMASITFGGGCLAFSSAIRDMGLINGLLLFFFIAFISFYTLGILTQAGIKTGIYDYNALIEKYLGHKTVVFSDINNLILCLGVIVGYQKFIYEFGFDILDYFFTIEKSEAQKIQLYLIIVCLLLIQIPLTSLKKISVLQYASITGSMALIYSIICICIKMPKNYADSLASGEKLILFEAFSLKYLVSISVFLFGFSSHNGIFQIYVELNRPSAERYSKVLNRSFILEMFLYLFISISGYFSFLSKTQDNILNNFDSEDVAILISKISLFICLHCSMAINYNIMRQSYKSFFLKSEKDEFSWYKDMFFAFVTLIISNTIVYNLSSARQILGIVGGVCTVVICFWNPIMIHLKVNKFKWNSLENIFAVVVLVIVIILGTSSTVYSIYDYVQEIIKNNEKS